MLKKKTDVLTKEPKTPNSSKKGFPKFNFMKNAAKNKQVAVKKTKKGPATSKLKTKDGFKKFASFFKELKGELKRVVWPTKISVIHSTMTVFTIVIFVAVFVVLADYLFHNLLKTLVR